MNRPSYTSGKLPEKETREIITFMWSKSKKRNKKKAKTLTNNPNIHTHTHTKKKKGQLLNLTKDIKDLSNENF